MNSLLCGACVALLVYEKNKNRGIVLYKEIDIHTTGAERVQASKG